MCYNNQNKTYEFGKRENDMSKVKIKQIQRRSEIIEKVIPLIGSVPFDELSMAEICKAADISTGSFYHYFTKKSDILVGLLGIIDEYMETEAFACLTSEDEIENLMIFSRHWALYVDTHGLERSKLISTIEPAQEDISGEKRITTVKLEEIMTRGQEKRQIRADLSPEELAQMFLLALRGVTVDWSRVDGRYSVRARMEQYISLFVQALKA